MILVSISNTQTLEFLKFLFLDYWSWRYWRFEKTTWKLSPSPSPCWLLSRDWTSATTNSQSWSVVMFLQSLLCSEFFHTFRFLLCIAAVVFDCVISWWVLWRNALIFHFSLTWLGTWPVCWNYGVTTIRSQLSPL